MADDQPKSLDQLLGEGAKEPKGESSSITTGATAPVSEQKPSEGDKMPFMVNEGAPKQVTSEEKIVGERTPGEIEKERERFGNKRNDLRQQLVNKQNEAKHGRLEGDIGVNDGYWAVKQSVQQQMHQLDATPDEKLDELNF